MKSHDSVHMYWICGLAMWKILLTLGRHHRHNYFVSKISLYGSYYEIPGKACERYVFHVMADANVFEMPKIRTISVSLFFCSNSHHVLFFLKCPIFICSIILKCPFFELEWIENCAFQNNRTEWIEKWAFQSNRTY